MLNVCVGENAAIPHATISDVYIIDNCTTVLFMSSDNFCLYNEAVLV